MCMVSELGFNRRCSDEKSSENHICAHGGAPCKEVNPREEQHHFHLIRVRETKN